MEMMKARPPHLAFLMQAVEDRNKSIEMGCPQFTNVAHVRITALGSKDSVTKPAKEWLAACDQQVREERLPAEWAQNFHSAFEHWLRGEEIPVNGIPLVTWPAISPGELLTCKGLHIMTVEDLASANEEAKRRIGMGGLELVSRAKKYLDAAAGPGALLAENKALSERLKASEARRDEVEARIAALEAKFGAETKAQHIPTPPSMEDKLSEGEDE